MKEFNLYNLKASEVIDWIASEQAQKRGISKAAAKRLVIHALTYNVVTAEIDNQIDFLLGCEE